MKVLVTGGAGFIGSAVCRHLVRDLGYFVVNLDKLTYAANLSSLQEIEKDPNYTFEQVDICNGEAVMATLKRHRVDAVIHLAAESHVDRSIDGPAAFVQTNIVGTYTLLEAARKYWTDTLAEAEHFRFLHISTDEVFGDLLSSDDRFKETTPYAPSSPYSASKASSDHLARSWHRTYGLPVITTNCSNNYGPFQFPEKLIPLITLNAAHGKPLPVYGTGENVRDWLHVDDHVSALIAVLNRGRIGECYTIGGDSERTNLDVVNSICDILDMRFKLDRSRRLLIKHVSDRPGHDGRYAIDSSKIKSELGWVPQRAFETGLEQTIDWYLQNEWWWQPIRDGRYAGERLGL